MIIQRAFRAALVALYVLGAVALSQSYTPTLRGDIVTFEFREGGTVWDIWEQYSTESWVSFYAAVAALNPEQAENRFTSIPVGALIAVPATVLETSFIDSFRVVGQSNLGVDSEPISEQLEELRLVFLSQNSSIQSIKTAIETLTATVEVLETRVLENTPPVVSTQAERRGPTSEQWLIAASVLSNILMFIGLIVVSLSLLSLKRLRRDYAPRPVVVHVSRDRQRDKLEVGLYSEISSLRDDRKALIAENDKLTRSIAPLVHLFVENKELQERNETQASVIESLAERLSSHERGREPSVDKDPRDIRRGTRGKGRPANT